MWFETEQGAYIVNMCSCDLHYLWVKNIYIRVFPKHMTSRILNDNTQNKATTNSLYLGHFWSDLDWYLLVSSCKMHIILNKSYQIVAFKVQHYLKSFTIFL